MSKTALGRYIDSYGSRLTRAHPDVAAELDSTWRPFDEEISALMSERASIVGSSELTDLGKRKALEALHAKGTALVKRIDQAGRGRLDSLKAELEASERAADAQGRPERTPETLMLEREIRDRLQGTAAGVVRDRYLRAVADASDPLLVSAIENAPAAFPLVDVRVRAAARDVRIDASQQAPTIRKLREACEAHGALLEAAARLTTEALPEPLQAFEQRA